MSDDIRWLAPSNDNEFQMSCNHTRQDAALQWCQLSWSTSSWTSSYNLMSYNLTSYYLYHQPLMLPLVFGYSRVCLSLQKRNTICAIQFEWMVTLATSVAPKSRMASPIDVLTLLTKPNMCTSPTVYHCISLRHCFVSVHITTCKAWFLCNKH